MAVKRIVGLVLFAVGAVLLWQGWQSHQSVGSRIMETLQGSPSNHVLRLLGVGAMLLVVGIVLAARG